MTLLAHLLSFAGPVASPDDAVAAPPPSDTGTDADESDFGSLLAAALAGSTQPQPQPAAQPATAVESQPIREGVRFTEAAPPAAEPPVVSPQGATPPGQQLEATEANTQAVATDLPELPVEATTPALPALIEDDIRTALRTEFGATPDQPRVPTPTTRETAERRDVPATSNLVPPGLPAITPPTRPIVPAPTAQPVAAPVETVEPTPTVSPAITPAATIAAGGTPALPTLVPAQPTTLGPIPADPAAAAVMPTGIDRPAEPVEAAPAIAAVPTLTETPTREVRDRFVDVVGEIGERRLPKRPALDAGQTPVVPFETRLASQPAEAARPVDAVRPAPAAQVADAIVTRAEVIGKGEQAEFRLRLDPPELGHIEVRIHRTAAGIHADLRVADEAVRQMIESQLPELRQRLEAAGLPVDRFNLTTDDGSTGRDRQQRFESEQPEDRRAPRRATAPTGPKTYTPPVAAGRLDITA